MLPTDTWDKIQGDRILETVKEYPLVVPEKLKTLDQFRLETVPESLRLRKNDGKPYLEKQELLKLVEWKLYATAQYQPWW